MEITKAGIFSVVGRPNAGKSTLVNALCGTKIAIVSKKPQTTRTRITGVKNHGDCQMIFLDTPGLHKPRTRLGDYMVKIVNSTVSAVDVAILVVPPVAKIGDAERQLIERIRSHKLPSVLVINKIDTLAREALFAVAAEYTKAHDFTAVVPVSALTGEGLEALTSELERLCFESPQLFPDGMISDQPERAMAAEIIREKMLENLEEEIPHGVAVEIETLEERDSGSLYIGAAIYCERKSHKGIIIGKRGSMLKKVGVDARAELEEMYDKVFLELWVKVKENWRDVPRDVRNFGYKEE